MEISLKFRSKAKQKFGKENLSDYRATKQEIRYVATRNAQSRGRSEHKEIKMIITSEADIMFDVLTG